MNTYVGMQFETRSVSEFSIQKRFFEKYQKIIEAEYTTQLSNPHQNQQLPNSNISQFENESHENPSLFTRYFQ